MAIVIQRTPWVRYPTYAPTINLGHQSAAGLRHFWLFSVGRDFAADIITGTRFTNNGTFGGITQNGLKVEGTASNSYWTATLPASIPPPITILTGRVRSTGVVSWSLGVSGAWTGYYSDENAGANNIRTTNAADFTGAIDPVVARKDDPFGIVYSAYTMSGANDLRGCTGGGAVAADTSCAAPSGTITTLRLGASPLADNTCNAYFRLLCIWTRSFSNSELQSISANPWQLFTPLTRRIWVPSVAAAGEIIGPLIGGSHLLTNGPLVNGRLAA